MLIESKTADEREAFLKLDRFHSYHSNSTRGTVGCDRAWKHQIQGKVIC